MKSTNDNSNSDSPVKKGMTLEERARQLKQRKTIAGIVIGIVLVIGILVLVINAIRKSDRTDMTKGEGDANSEALSGAESKDMEVSEAQPDQSGNLLGEGIIEHIINAFGYTDKANEERPLMVEITEDNKDTFVSIDACKIENNLVCVDYSSELGIAKSDDKFYYLFALKSYDDSENLEDYEYVNKAYKNDKGQLTCVLKANSKNSKLYNKFGVAVKIDDKYELIGRTSFITNPEVLGTKAKELKAKSKKGILIDYSRVYSGQLEDLGVNQAAINIPVSSIIGPTTNAAFPSIQYSYNGKNYTFNGTVIAGFDATVSTLTEKEIQTTAIILNDYSYAYIDLIHPDARTKGSCPYYMFNGATDEGVELLAAVGSFLSSRYAGDKHGVISNYVIANEIDARKEWNYMKYTDVDSYTREYAKAFRVFYTAIVSNNNKARVMISLDQHWDLNRENSSDYDGKDVLDSFNNYIAEYGNIDWALAYHPYNIPLTSCKTWDSSKYVTHNSNTPTISMKNIEVLINYLKQDHFLDSNGECRSIMITELGYTSTAGEKEQAAALAYAFYKINNYDEIDGLLLNRQTDDATEIAQGLATGITTSGGKKKLSYDVFKYMDTDEWESHLEFAKSVIGITSWGSIMK